jgi:hypothetical protein
VQMSAERLREPAQRVADRLKSLIGIAPIEGGNVKKLKQIKNKKIRLPG